MVDEEDYIEEENSKTPVVPQEPVDEEEAAEAAALAEALDDLVGPDPVVGRETVNIPPVAKVFICARCKSGKLDPTGLKMGDAMACPECGHLTKVTLEHLMGEARASRRQQAKKAFEEMDDEEKAEFLASKTGLEKLIIFVRYRLGAKGSAAIYLGLVVVVAALVITYLLVFGNYEMRSVSIWVVVGTVVGAAVFGVAAHFAYVTLMFHYKKMLNSKGGGSGSRRTSARRRRSSIRTKPPEDEDEDE